MTCHDLEHAISDLVDGTLPGPRRTAVEAHLATCARCRALAADFATLRAATRRLELHTPPELLWTRLAAQVAPAPEPRRGWALPALEWRSAMAASILLALLTGATWFSFREAASRSAADRSAAAAAAGDVTDPASPSYLHAPERAMRQEISNLEYLVTAESEVLPGETKAVYQATGAVIDDAIGQSTAMLQSEPANELAQQSLFEALRSKLALLQEMIALINEMRKGDQEAAARIVSGLDQ